MEEGEESGAIYSARAGIVAHEPPSPCPRYAAVTGPNAYVLMTNLDFIQTCIFHRECLSILPVVT